MAIVTTKTLRHGFVREDGFVFVSYRTRKDGSFKEEWYSPEKFKLRREKSRKGIRSKRYSYPDRAKTPEEARRRKLEWRRKYYQRHVETFRKKAKLYKMQRAEYEKLRLATWAKNNRGKRRATDAKRRAAFAKTLPTLTETDKALIETFYEAASRVSHCAGIPFHVDHVFPISKGGLHVPENLQLLPAKLNLAKGNRVL